MAHKVSGNTRSMNAAALKRIERLYRRQIAADQLVPLEFGRELYELSCECGRRIGVLVSREGEIEEVFVGSKDILYLPDLGRYRLAEGRLRRLRLIFGDLSRGHEPHLPNDIITDLERLRLDAVTAVKNCGNRTTLAYAYLVPGSSTQAFVAHRESVQDLGRTPVDFSELIGRIEDSLAGVAAPRRTPGLTPAVLVGVYPKGATAANESMQELAELARTAGMQILDSIIQRRDADPRTLVGTGKLQEIVLRCLQLDAEMLVFDGELKPAQWRALVNASELKILDRSMVILDIFAQRASSSEGRLQVELAQLKYNLPRLVEKDAGLSRLSGGIGGRGPGETKLEIGRRRIRDRITMLEKQINQLSDQRERRRERRAEGGLPQIAILGYTNVGKSTLFNALTSSTVLVENKLFATLDPTTRKLDLGADANAGRLSAIIADTVGFIRDLPIELKNAFRATLEELYTADLLVEVLDASDPYIATRHRAVEVVLKEMKLSDSKRIIVLNKIDRCDSNTLNQLMLEYDAVAISAKDRSGLDILRQKLRDALWSEQAKAGQTTVDAERGGSWRLG